MLSRGVLLKRFGCLRLQVLDLFLDLLELGQIELVSVGRTRTEHLGLLDEDEGVRRGQEAEHEECQQGVLHEEPLLLLAVVVHHFPDVFEANIISLSAHFLLQGQQVLVLFVESMAEDVKDQHIDQLLFGVSALLYYGICLVTHDLLKYGSNVLIHSLFRDLADAAVLQLEFGDHVLGEVLEPLLFVPDDGPSEAEFPLVVVLLLELGVHFLSVVVSTWLCRSLLLLLGSLLRCSFEITFLFFGVFLLFDLVGVN